MYNNIKKTFILSSLILVWTEYDSCYILVAHAADDFVTFYDFFFLKLIL